MKYFYLAHHVSVDDVFVWKDLYEGKYAPDLKMQKRLEDLRILDFDEAKKQAISRKSATKAHDFDEANRNKQSQGNLLRKLTTLMKQTKSSATKPHELREVS